MGVENHFEGIGTHKSRAAANVIPASFDFMTRKERVDAGFSTAQRWDCEPPVHGAKISRLPNTTRARTAAYSQYFCEPSGDTEPSGFR